MEEDSIKEENHNNSIGNGFSYSDSKIGIPDFSRKVVLNISGAKYETFEETLERFPDSLLGNKERRKHYYDLENREYFFDRNRTCFEAILSYYQTNGHLLRPHTIPINIFVNDVKFFDLGDEAVDKVMEEIMDEGEEEERPMPKNKLRAAVWQLFEYPDSSNYARCVAVFSVSVILLSICLFCLETLPQFKEPNITSVNRTKEEQQLLDEHATVEHVFFIFEAICIAWFTVELVTRFITSPTKLKFILTALNIIDLVAILPFFVTLIVGDDKSSNVSSLAILRAVRLVRVFRIFKLSRYSRGLQILGCTLKASLRELGLLFFFLCVGVILFASAVYYAELGDPNTFFLSIPHAFWWAIITMTTVGYGDMYPVTLAGKLVGCLCAITGVLAIALPVPVIVSNFAYYYGKEQERSANEEENKTQEERDLEKIKENRKFWSCLQKQDRTEYENCEYTDEVRIDMENINAIQNGKKSNPGSHKDEKESCV